MEVIRIMLEQQPMMALFLTIAIGYLIGEINIKGFSLGVGAVLFVALGMGWFAPKSAPAPMVGTLGLALFLYGVGVQYGKQFFTGLASVNGRKANLLALIGVLAAWLLGYLRRTGPLNWTIPISANLVMRNLSLTLFLAQVGMASGPKFAATVADTGLLMLGLGGLVLLALVLPIMLFGLFLFRRSYDEVVGDRRRGVRQSGDPCLWQQAHPHPAAGHRLRDDFPRHDDYQNPFRRYRSSPAAMIRALQRHIETS